MNTRLETLPTQPLAGARARRQAEARLRSMLLVQAAWALLLLLGVAASVGAQVLPAAAPQTGLEGPPPRLSETGLYAAGSTRQTAPGVASFSPQYPLWSDGAEKRRWAWLPPGSVIDGSNPDAWVFPPGTRLWKEFSHAGQPVETRFIERRLDGSWRYASYVWSADGGDAVLAPAKGIAALPVPAAPGGRYAIPAQADCRACHGGAAVPVLGLGALQLSPQRDPMAPNRRPLREGDVDLRALVERGWLTGLPLAVLATPPRIAADTPVERAALGYLHANCSHCHNSSGAQVPVRLTLAQSVADPLGSRDAALRSAVEAPSRYRPPGVAGDAQVIVPGSVEASVLSQRMQSRHPQVRMPPLGTDVIDPEGLALITRWITQDLTPRKETYP